MGVSGSVKGSVHEGVNCGSGNLVPEVTPNSCSVSPVDVAKPLPGHWQKVSLRLRSEHGWEEQ